MKILKSLFRNAILVVSVVIILAMLIWNLIVFYDQDQMWVNDLYQLALWDIIAFPTAALFFHVWSIQYLKTNNKILKKKRAGFCHYCHKKATGPLLCGECLSIQWPNLNFLESVAVFTAQHRWQLLTAYFFLFIATPLSFIYTLKVEKETEFEQRLEEVRQVQDTINNIRTLILTIESCNDQFIDMHLYRQLISGYTRFTWDFNTEMNWFYQHNKIGINKEVWKTARDSVSRGTKSVTLQKNLFNPTNPNYPINLAAYLIESDFDPSQSQHFRTYSSLVNSNVPNLQARKEAALYLVEGLKVTNTFISLITLDQPVLPINPDNAVLEASTLNFTYLKNNKPDPDSWKKVSGSDSLDIESLKSRYLIRWQ